MKIREIMTQSPVTCSSRDNLSSVSLQMWDSDCGVLPVVDDGVLQGVITDRDICMGLTFKGAAPHAVLVADVIDGHAVYTCSPDDDVREAMKTMKEHQVRRLPVVEEGRLIGLLSLNDMALAARTSGFDGPSYADVVGVMQAVCSHRELPVAA